MMFHYARASLLLYLSWAVEHEYPYLDKPDILDFPNETGRSRDAQSGRIRTRRAACAEDLARNSKSAQSSFTVRASMGSTLLERLSFEPGRWCCY